MQLLVQPGRRGRVERLEAAAAQADRDGLVEQPVAAEAVAKDAACEYAVDRERRGRDLAGGQIAPSAGLAVDRVAADPTVLGPEMRDDVRPVGVYFDAPRLGDRAMDAC